MALAAIELWISEMELHAIKLRQFRIEKTEISNQTILVIKDFAEKSDIKDQTQLWDYQVKELFHRLGN